MEPTGSLQTKYLSEWKGAIGLADGQADRPQDGPLHLSHDRAGELATEALLTQELLRKGRDLLAFEHRILWDTSLRFLETHVSRRGAQYRTRGNDEDVAGQPVASVDRYHEAGPKL